MEVNACYALTPQPVEGPSPLERRTPKFDNTEHMFYNNKQDVRHRNVAAPTGADEKPRAGRKRAEMEIERPTERGQEGSADDKPLRRVDDTRRRACRGIRKTATPDATLPRHTLPTRMAPGGETPNRNAFRASESVSSRRGASWPRSADPSGERPGRASERAGRTRVKAACGTEGRADPAHGVRRRETEPSTMKGRALARSEALRAAASEAAATLDDTPRRKGGDTLLAAGGHIRGETSPRGPARDARSKEPLHKAQARIRPSQRRGGDSNTDYNR